MVHNIASGKAVAIGVALAVTGYVSIKGIDGIQKILNKGDMLHGDDQVVTGPDGEIIIGFADGSSLELAKNTAAILDSEVFDVGEIREMHGHNVVLQNMHHAILSEADISSVLDTAQQSYESSNDSTNVVNTPLTTNIGEQQPIGGDIEIHSMPEMVLPKMSISNISILEPQPGNESEEHDSDHEDSTHGTTGGGTGHDSGSDSGHEEGSDSGHEEGSDSGHEGGSDSGHESGSEGGFSAGHGGGYGYAGGSLSSIAVFTVSLSSPALHDVRVDFKTIDGTAISGGSGVASADYGHTSGQLIIPAGQSSGTIEVTIFSDKLVEVDEHFFLTLSNPVNAMIVDDTAIGTIIDSGHGEGTEGEGIVLTGTEGDDVLITKGGADVLDGLGGNDTLIAGGGPDIIHGGEGDDLIVGLGGPDELYGDEGNDEIIGHGGPDLIDGGEGDDIIYAGGAPDTVTGGPGDDFINAGGGPDYVSGGEGNDTIYGGGGPDVLEGDQGNDVIRGEGGPDILRGGPGNDELYGGGGPDQLIGGEGADILKGGGSGDVFRFESLDGSVDRILDFDQHDQLDLSAILDFEEGDPVTEYVQFLPSDSDQTSYELSVNPTGTGNADDFQLVAIMENMNTEPDIDQLLNNGNLIVIE